MEFIEQCQIIAKKHFNIDTLRSEQKDVLSLIFKKKFVLATLPTGGGKTLLYAIPAMIFNQGPIIVISPLISLMRDQARRMDVAGIPSVLFTSDQTDIERKKSNSDFWNTDTKIIFTSPERFVLSSFFTKLIKLKPSMVVVDEAHCVIAWGHQFRPEYSQIGHYLNQLKPERILAITATASGVTRQEMIQKLFQYDMNVAQFISKPIGQHIFVSGIRTFSFEEKKEKLLNILEATASQKSIIYFSTKKESEDIAVYLKNKKLRTVVYHAGFSKEKRLQIETYIQHTKEKVIICATTAFGLGVDILDVILVVVYGFPANIEEFLQMVGRAGRSGQPSKGVLLWTGSDPVKRDYQFKELFQSPSVFFENCKKIVDFFPKSDWESCFVLKEDIYKVLFTHTKTKNKEKALEGFFGALRICHMIKDILLHEEYYQITLNSNVSLFDLLLQLPQTLTKRKKLFDGIKVLTNDALFEIKSVTFILSVNEILNVTNLTQQIVEDVFSYYSVQNAFSFVRITAEQAKEGIILKRGFQILQKNLDKYTKARKYFFSSFQELKKLSEAPRCRLESSFRYFEVPSVYKQSNYCLQCDLCQHYRRI